MSEVSDITIQTAIQSNMAAVVKYIGNKQKIPTEEAIKMFMRSKTYEALMLHSTYLWSEPEGYIVDKYKKELAGDWEGWAKRR